MIAKFFEDEIICWFGVPKHVLTNNCGELITKCHTITPRPLWNSELKHCPIGFTQLD
jgi:hypothetical protein